MSFAWQKKRCKIGVSSRNSRKIAPTYSYVKLVHIKHLHLKIRERKEKKPSKQTEILSVGDRSPVTSEHMYQDMLSSVEKHGHGKNRLCFNLIFYLKKSCLTDNGIFYLSKADVGWKWHYLAWGSFTTPPWFCGSQQYILGKLNQMKPYPSSTKHQVFQIQQELQPVVFSTAFCSPCFHTRGQQKPRKEKTIQTRNIFLHSVPVHHMQSALETELSSPRVLLLLLQWQGAMGGTALLFPWLLGSADLPIVHFACSCSDALQHSSSDSKWSQLVHLFELNWWKTE